MTYNAQTFDHWQSLDYRARAAVIQLYRPDTPYKHAQTVWMNATEEQQEEHIEGVRILFQAARPHWYSIAIAADYVQLQMDQARLEYVADYEVIKCLVDKHEAFVDTCRGTYSA